MNLFHPALGVVAAAATLAVGLAARAVQVNAPAGPEYAYAGCDSGAGEECGLRVYQVMVESFVDGDPNHNHNAGYGTSHHRGDLRGIIQSLDYIQGIGMNAVWLTPVFDTHAGDPQDRLFGFDAVDTRLDATGYYARDYFKIDPNFGTLADAQELVDEAHARGLYVFFDGVFGHHKGALVPSPTGKLPVDSTNPADYPGGPASYPGRVVDYAQQATLDFYKEVATYWIDELGIDGWRLDQGQQVPLSAWREIQMAVAQTSADRAAAGEEWGTLGYMVSEIFSGDPATVAAQAYGTDANPALASAFDFSVRYATVGVVGAEESGLAGRPASTLNDPFAYTGHYQTLPGHALPNLMIGNHDLVRFGDLIQRADLADPSDAEYWSRHKLAFLVQAAHTGPITRYYGEELGDELPGYADQVTGNCAAQGLCDDHVARTSAKVFGVTVGAGDLSADQIDLLLFHQDLMAVREANRALSHGSRQHLYSDADLYADLKTLGDEQVVFAMNVSEQTRTLDLSVLLFDGSVDLAWDLLAEAAVPITGGSVSVTLPPLSGAYVRLSAATPGDYNGDGVVDGLDYGVWSASLGQAGADLAADGNADGVVDAADFAVWREAESVAASVPEPGAATLTLLYAAVLFRRGRQA